MDDFQLAVLCGPHPSALSASQAAMLQPTHRRAMGSGLQVGKGGTARPGSLLRQPEPSSHSAAGVSPVSLLPRYLEAFQGAQHSLAAMHLYFGDSGFLNELLNTSPSVM